MHKLSLNFSIDVNMILLNDLSICMEKVQFLNCFIKLVLAVYFIFAATVIYKQLKMIKRFAISTHNVRHVMCSVACVDGCEKIYMDDRAENLE